MGIDMKAITSILVQSFENRKCFYNSPSPMLLQLAVTDASTKLQRASEKETDTRRRSRSRLERGWFQLSRNRLPGKSHRTTTLRCPKGGSRIGDSRGERREDRGEGETERGERKRAVG
uniref:Uncharacterized protein n=1 Tax=Opuntia streptacantha TaxID=393608 RepID=A0A7C8ZLP7_OPUST